MVGTAHLHITGRLAVSSRNRRARQHPCWTAFETLTRPRTHHRGGHPIRDVVADDEFVEHPGNAGRPRTIKPRPIASMHRPSGWSRSYVLASLRALHLDQHLRPGALRTKRALTPAARTGNAGRAASRSPPTLGAVWSLGSCRSTSIATTTARPGPSTAPSKRQVPTGTGNSCGLLCSLELEIHESSTSGARRRVTPRSSAWFPESPAFGWWWRRRDDGRGERSTDPSSRRGPGGSTPAPESSSRPRETP